MANDVAVHTVPLLVLGTHGLKGTAPNPGEPEQMSRHRTHVVSRVSGTNSEFRREARVEALQLGLELAGGSAGSMVAGAPCPTLKTWLRQEEAAGEDVSRSGRPRAVRCRLLGPTSGATERSGPVGQTISRHACLPVR